LAGIAKFLKEKNESTQIGLVDPFGASLYSYYKDGELKSEGSSVTEGIGQGRITKNLEDLRVDFPIRLPDQEALDVMFKMVETEGLYLGGSAGMNVAGAIHLAKEMGPGNNIVTILCDSGSRYLSKLYNRNFLVNNELPCPEWI